jgi:lysophospholipase L1-like esterase
MRTGAAGRRVRRWSGLVGAAALTAGLTLLGAPSAVAAPGDTHVALGDSYAAGPLITPQDPTRLFCLRSLANYPHVAAARDKTVLTDVSCSGAQTEDMFSAQTTYEGGTNPPQLDALKPDTDIVTITIGGNDIGFTGIIENCAAYSPNGPTRSGAQTCKAFYTAGGTDQLAARIDATRPDVDEVLRAISARSPQARVYVAGYPAILPESSRDAATVCWPQMPLTTTDVDYLRGVEKQLNQMLADSAAANGATYVDTYTPTIGHDACKPPVIRYVEPLVPVGDAAPVHPNRGGAAAVGKIVAKVMT